MKQSVRIRFFAWLGVQTAVIFIATAVVLLLFNLHERHEHPEMAGEEAEEAVVVAGVMLLLFPLGLASAWIISRRLLRPWQQMVAQAERIGAGHLDERLEVPNPDDEVGRLATTLNRAFDNYDKLMDRLQRFSFDASHQLRNPLAAIRTSGEVCLLQPRSSEEYRSVIGGMLEDTQRLSRTVEQLLSLARATQGALDEYREDVDVRDVMQDVLREARLVGEGRNVQITLREIDRPLRIRGVRELIREAITNLIDNALRFSPEGGTILVELSASPGDRVRISVSDEGPGLPPERKVTLFRPFSGDRRDERANVGLGLVISSDICRAHGGAIGVENREGGGCIFWMEFPLFKTSFAGILPR